MQEPLQSLTNNPNLEQYKQQATELLREWREGGETSQARGKRHHPDFEARSEAGLALADAQLVLAREHGFESWKEFAAHLAELEACSGPTFLFETAVDAVVEGNTGRLSELLAKHPELARERSSRIHQATLLHYVSANGVEDSRQRSPANATQVATMLLNAGADVTATARAYHGDWTALGLLASSAHPHVAGVQSSIARVLVEGGAGNSHDLLLALAFGYLETASVIAAIIEVDNVLVAAGLGDSQRVARWCLNARQLAPECSVVSIPGQPQLGAEAHSNLEQSLIWAARLGHLDVVRLLLERGVDPGAKGPQGFSSAHWAAVYGRVGILDLLIQANAPLEQTNAYGGTVLSTAVFAAVHPEMHFEGGCATNRQDIDYSQTVSRLLKAGAQTHVPMFFPTKIPALDALLREAGVGD